MSKLTQYIAVLNAPKCPTRYDFAFFFDSLEKSHVDYAKARRTYRKNLLEAGIILDSVDYKDVE